MRHIFIGLVWLLSVLLVGCPAAEAPRPSTTLSDVSLVWPLPEGEPPFADDGYLLAPSEVGPTPLLPRHVFDQIPELTRTDEPDDLYANLLVVGARLDPCFHEGAGEPVCQPNLRLVLQPIVRGDRGFEARDASVHLFFSAKNEGEILETIEALARARVELSDEPPGPLRVHPLLRDGEGRARVAALLRPLLGADRLARVTAIDVHGGDAAWTFSGFDWVEGAAVPIVIPATGGADTQHFLSLYEDRLEGAIEPANRSVDTFSLLVEAPSNPPPGMDELQAAFDAAARVENPAMHNPGTVDCVSCHIAPIARASALRLNPLTASPDAFTSDHHDLTPTSNFANPRLVRAFGYRFGELVISPRVIHESAAVADRVEQTLSNLD